MRVLTLIVIAALFACSDDGARHQDGNETAKADIQPVLNPSLPSQRSRSFDERWLQEEGSLDARAVRGAREALQRYFALVEAGRHAEAAKSWWDSGRAAAFTAELGRLEDFRPSIAAPGRTRSAAGSTYVEVSLQLLRDAASASRSLSDGTAVLRGVDDTSGAEAGRIVWRIDRIALQPPPVAQLPGGRPEQP